MFQSLSIQISLFMSRYVLVVFVLSSEGYNETILYVVKCGYCVDIWVNILFLYGELFSVISEVKKIIVLWIFLLEMVKGFMLHQHFSITSFGRDNSESQ